MIAAPISAPESVLAERLQRGANLLFDLEQRGETGSDYQRWFRHWLELLREYEGLEAE